MTLSSHYQKIHLKLISRPSAELDNMHTSAHGTCIFDVKTHRLICLLARMRQVLARPGPGV